MKRHGFFLVVYFFIAILLTWFLKMELGFKLKISRIKVLFCCKTQEPCGCNFFAFKKNYL